MNQIIGMPQGNIELLRSSIQGFLMEHGVYPYYELMSSDVARAVFREVDANRMKYGSLIKIGGDLQPMKIMFGPAEGIEMAQVVGSNRVELVVDPIRFNVQRRTN